MRFGSTRRQFIGLAGSALASNRISRNRLLAQAVPDDAAVRWSHLLWFTKPAPQWADALPVGNGRVGAMVFGGYRSERIGLNEDTLWSGAPKDWNNPDAVKHLPVVRDMVLKTQDYQAADKEMRKMQGPFNEAYEPLGDLLIDLDHREEVEEYRRELNLDTAVAKVSYRVQGTRYTREVFVSHPAQVMVVRLTAVGKAGIGATIRLKSALQSRCEAPEDGVIYLMGKAPSYSAPNYLASKDPVQYSEEPGKGMHFAAVLHAATTGGSSKRQPDGSLRVQGASTVLLVVGMATGYKGYAVAPDLSAGEVLEAARRPVERVRSRSVARVLSEHLADHRGLYRRAGLDLAPLAQGPELPTDQRIAAFNTVPDPALLALYFNHGRYLLLTSSRPGTQPANLQGIWSGEVRPPWSSNWTSNINVQMNYWPVETCNLSECHTPLFDMVTDLSHNGAETARVNYGAKGWVSHHNVDLWRQSGPVGMGLAMADPTWANFCMSGPWLCAHFQEHYRFTGDKEFLRASYPVMKGAAEFCLSWLVEGPDGRLTTCPSVSTENSFRAPNGKRAYVSAGCTYDIAVIRELFASVVAATEVLDADHEFARTLAATLARLPEYKIGRHGELQEWSLDFEEDQPGQRHMSHLYPVYPGAEITPRNNPRLAGAARKSLERRLANGGAYTGWSRAWAIGLWARLEDGEMAWESLKMLIEHSTGANLFDTHPAEGGSIFQIDGNFGATAAMAELLLQSHDAEISFLPALPTAWKEGAVHGLRARGGLEVSLAWSDGRLKTVGMLALRDGRHRLRVPRGQRIVGAATSHGDKVAVEVTDSVQVVSMEVRSGSRYMLSLAVDTNGAG